MPSYCKLRMVIDLFLMTRQNKLSVWKALKKCSMGWWKGQSLAAMFAAMFVVESLNHNYGTHGCDQFKNPFNELQTTVGQADYS